VIQPLLCRLLAEGIIPNAGAIAEIVRENRISVLVFEPSDDTRAAAISLGWNDGTSVIQLSRKRAKRLAEGFRKMGDSVSARWFERQRGPARIFVLIHDGTLLVNFEQGKGCSIEPRSADSDWMS
jgi:hypothetical protein